MFSLQPYIPNLVKENSSEMLNVMMENYFRTLFTIHGVREGNARKPKAPIAHPVSVDDYYVNITVILFQLTPAEIYKLSHVFAHIVSPYKNHVCFPSGCKFQSAKKFKGCCEKCCADFQLLNKFKQ